MGQGPSPPTALHRGDGGEPPIGIARPRAFNALINMLIIRPYYMLMLIILTLAPEARSLSQFLATCRR